VVFLGGSFGSAQRKRPAGLGAGSRDALLPVFDCAFSPVVFVRFSFSLSISSSQGARSARSPAAVDQFPREQVVFAHPPAGVQMQQQRAMIAA